MQRSALLSTGTLLAVLALALAAGCAPDDPSTDGDGTTDAAAPPNEHTPERNSTMPLGAFSVSLAVQDIAASQAFYTKLGFEQVGGEPKQNWVILRNGTTTIGLFQGMFPSNVMTFNPGWSPTCETLPEFEDVRDLQARLKASGVTFTTEADPDGDGPASCTLVDPDGNAILFDQHVPRPE